MKNILRFSLLLVFSANAAWAQNEWHPYFQEGPGRVDDFHFLNDSTLFLVRWTDDDGGGRELVRSKDKGQSFQRLSFWPSFSLSYYRSIKFFNDSVGLIGTLQKGLIRTTNAGLSWDSVFLNMSQQPRSICGLFKLNDQVVYAIGDYASHARLYKSTNAGLDWTLMDLSALAEGLVDGYFLNEQVGFVIGRAVPADSGAVILYTDNGGQSWTRKIWSGRAGDISWKIFFTPDRQTVYTSIQNFPPAASYFFKSTDGGQNWVRKPFNLPGDSVSMVQGIGFTETGVGWAGGHFNTGFVRTLDGGENWQHVITSQARGFNRFYRHTDGSFWVSGASLYKLSFDSVQVPLSVSTSPARPELALKAYPNPVQDELEVVINIDHRSLFNLYALNLQANQYLPVKNGVLLPGQHSIKIDVNGWKPGIYFLALETDQLSQVLKIIKL